MKHKRLSWVVIVSLITLIFILIYTIFIRPNYYLFNGGNIHLKAVQAGKLDLKAGARIETMGGFLYIATREGLTKSTLEGEHVWNKSYHFKELLFIEKEKYLATIDITGKEAFIFDETGQIAHIKTDYTIVSGTLNKVGHLVLVLENKGEHFINLYDFQGALVVRRRTIFKEDGYPISVGLSPDGRKMVTSHLNVSHHSIESVITFMDFSSEGESFEDRITGHIRIEGTMASEVIFLDRQYCVVIGDNKMLFYRIEKVPELIATVDLTAEIIDIVNTNADVIINFGKSLKVENNDMTNKIILFSKEGKLIKSYEEQDVNKQIISDDEMYYIVTGYQVTRYKGEKKIWTTELHKEVEKIHALENKKFLVVYMYDYEILKIEDI